MVNAIVSHKLKCVYITIPKSACSSIRHLILKHENKNNALVYNPKELQKMVKTSTYSYPEYFWFTFLRNPIDRFISAYADKCLNYTGGEIYKPLHNVSLENLYDAASNGDEYIDPHLRSQLYFIKRYMHPDELDFIGTVENFSQDIGILKDILGIYYDPEHLRKTSSVEISENMKSGILERYNEDWELWQKYS